MEHDPRLADNTLRRQNLTYLIAHATVTQESVFWLEQLRAVGIPCGPVYHYDTVFQDPQVLARALVVESEHPRAGRVRMVGKPVKFAAPPATDLTPAPLLGAHTTEILLALGYQEEAITQLRREGVV